MRQDLPNTSDEVQSTKASGETFDQMPTTVELLSQTVLKKIRLKYKRSGLPVYSQGFAKNLMSVTRMDAP